MDFLQIIGTVATEAISTAAIAICDLVRRRSRPRKRYRRRFGVHPINRRRNRLGHFATLYPELRAHTDRFVRHFRVTPDQFDELLALVNPHLPERDQKNHNPICNEMRLALTLRFLASGDQISSLASNYRIGDSTCREIINEVCSAIWNGLGPIYLQPPSADDYKKIASGFYQRWNLPHCLGALDGKHFVIQKPPNSGSMYFSYKKVFSVVMLAVCDSRYAFTHVDIGHCGSECDAGIFNDTQFGQFINDQTLKVPPAESLPKSDQSFKYFFVGDEAFGLKENLFIPFAGERLRFWPGMSRKEKQEVLMRRIFNYRLIRSRRTIENTFGICANRFLLFMKPMTASPESAVKFIQAAVVLHNYLILSKPDVICKNNAENDVQENEWLSDLSSSQIYDLPIHSAIDDEPDCKIAKILRENLAVYLSTVDTMPNQLEYVTSAERKIRKVYRTVCPT